MSEQNQHSLNRLPVIIPSYKGRGYVDGAISALPQEYFRPIVAANGHDDGTVDRALELGVEAFSSQEQGKMPAIQEALRYLGEKALQPLVIMDVDTRIIRPRAWAVEAHRALDRFVDQPLYLTAPLIFTHHNPFEAASRTAWYNAKIANNKRDHTEADGPAPLNAHYGPNTLLQIKDSTTLEQMLDLDNYWPGEDRAMADVVLDNGGTFHQSRSPDMLAHTPLSEAYDPMLKAGVRKLARKVGLRSLADTSQLVEDNYTQRGPSGSRPYPKPSERVNH